jgi:uncharacterized phage-associated protein
VAESVDDVAAYVTAHLGAVTPGRLQALVYYAHAWHVAEHGEPLYADAVEARSGGPEVRRLRERRRPAGDPARLGARARAVLEWVLRTYGTLPEGELSRTVRVEAPWRLARGGRRAGWRPAPVIDTVVMAGYYGRLRTSPRDAVTVAVGSARLEGYEFGPRAVDGLLAAATGTRPADDLVAELVARYREP